VYVFGKLLSGIDMQSELRFFIGAKEFQELPPGNYKFLSLWGGKVSIDCLVYHGRFFKGQRVQIHPCDTFTIFFKILTKLNYINLKIL